MRAQGVLKGDRVALLGENSPNWAIAYLAVTAMGAVAVPVMFDFSPVEIEFILRHSAAKTLFVSGRHLTKLEAEEYPLLQTRVLLDDFSIIPEQVHTALFKQLLQDGKREFDKIKIAALRFAGLLQDEPEEEDLASIIYTSGTTGHSKGVMLTHKNLVANALSIRQMAGVVTTDIMLSILPLSHAMESTLGLLTPLLAGASVYYLDKPPTPALLLPALEKVRPTIMVSVPLIIEKIFRNRIAPRFRKGLLMRALYGTPVLRKKINRAAGKKLLGVFGGRLRMYCIGGAPLAEDVENFLREAGFPYSVGYGLTETSPLVTGDPAVTYRYKTVGRKIPGVDVRIAEAGETRGVGEVQVKGDNVMRGYYLAPELNAAVFTADGWLKTGDLGSFDADGYLMIRGRIKNMLLGANGKNIYPEEIEAKINEMPFVTESMVYSRDGKICARVHPDYKSLDEDAAARKLTQAQVKAEIERLMATVLEEINKRVPSYARLQAVIEQEEPFEKTPTLKIKRYLYT